MTSCHSIVTFQRMHRLSQSLREGNFFCIFILHHAFQFLCIFHKVISFPQFSFTPLLRLKTVLLPPSSFIHVSSCIFDPHSFPCSLNCSHCFNPSASLPLPSTLKVYKNITGYWMINITSHTLTMSSISNIYKPTAPSTRSAASEYTKKEHKPQCALMYDTIRILCHIVLPSVSASFPKMCLSELCKTCLKVPCSEAQLCQGRICWDTGGQAGNLECQQPAATVSFFQHVLRNCDPYQHSCVLLL